MLNFFIQFFLKKTIQHRLLTISSFPTQFLWYIWMIHEWNFLFHGIILFVLWLDKIWNPQNWWFLSLFNDIKSDRIWKARASCSINVHVLLLLILFMHSKLSRGASFHLLNLLENVYKLWHTFVDCRLYFFCIFLCSFFCLERKVASHWLVARTIGFVGLALCNIGTLEFNNLNLLSFRGLILLFNIVLHEISIVTSFGLRLLLSLFWITTIIDLEQLLVFWNGW